MNSVLSSNLAKNLMTEFFFFLIQGEISLDKEMDLTNPGVAVLSLRDDSKILASGGWDSRYDFPLDCHIYTIHKVYV